MPNNAERLSGLRVILRAGGYTARVHIFAPPRATLLSAGVADDTAVTAQFNVTYTGFSDAAKQAFQAAVDIWSVSLQSPTTIRVSATWTPLAAGVLGQAGPANFQRNFAGALRADTWYPTSLAGKLAGQDLEGGGAHITAEFNSNFENWYFGTDGETPADRYDLMSVVLHELGHGLGFIGSMDVSDSGLGTWGSGTNFPIVYDHFVENAQGEKLLDTEKFPKNSPQLAGQLQSNQLFFDGANVRGTNNNAPVRIYSPIVWQAGSSYSHLNEVSFPSGNPNSLMTPQIGMGEAIHAPGQVGLALLRDLGW